MGPWFGPLLIHGYLSINRNQSESCECAHCCILYYYLYSMFLCMTLDGSVFYIEMVKAIERGRATIWGVVYSNELNMNSFDCVTDVSH